MNVACPTPWSFHPRTPLASHPRTPYPETHVARLIIMRRAMTHHLSPLIPPPAQDITPTPSPMRTPPPPTPTLQKDKAGLQVLEPSRLAKIQSGICSCWRSAIYSPLPSPLDKPAEWGLLRPFEVSRPPPHPSSTPLSLPTQPQMHVYHPPLPCTGMWGCRHYNGLGPTHTHLSAALQLPKSAQPSCLAPPRPPPPLPHYCPLHTTSCCRSSLTQMPLNFSLFWQFYPTQSCWECRTME
jgi:hypothetical protein